MNNDEDVKPPHDGLSPGPSILHTVDQLREPGGCFTSDDGIGHDAEEDRDFGDAWAYEAATNLHGDGEQSKASFASGTDLEAEDEVSHGGDLACSKEPSTTRQKRRQQLDLSLTARLTVPHGAKLPSCATTEGSTRSPRLLPPDLWCLIFRQLARTLEPEGGLRGPDAVAADIVRAGLTCRTMHRAAAAGLSVLTSLVPQVHPATTACGEGEGAAAARPVGAGVTGPPRRSASDATAISSHSHSSSNSNCDVDWALWDAVLRQPLGCSAEDLTSAARQLGLDEPGAGSPKEELVPRVLGALGLQERRGCSAPARLWMAIRRERLRVSWGFNVRLGAALRDMAEAGEEPVQHALRCLAQADARRVLCAAYGSTAGLLEAHRACLPGLLAQRGRRAEEHQRELKQRRQRLLRRGVAT